MRSVFCVIVITIVGLLSSCSSDSDSNAYTSEERDLRTMLNHEWEVTHDFRFIQFELPLTEEKIISFLDNNETIHSEIKNHAITVGMNKKGGFYFIDENTKIGYEGEPLLDLLYSCTTQQGNKFTGTFTGFSVGEVAWEFYVRKIDENTMNLVMIHDKEGYPNLPYGNCTIYRLKKKGAWDEKTNFRKIFQRYRYYDNMIDKMAKAQENYERDVARGGCQ